MYTMKSKINLLKASWKKKSFAVTWETTSFEQKCGSVQNVHRKIKQNSYLEKENSLKLRTRYFPEWRQSEIKTTESNIECLSVVIDWLLSPFGYIWCEIMQTIKPKQNIKQEGKIYCVDQLFISCVNLYVIGWTTQSI